MMAQAEGIYVLLIDVNKNFLKKIENIFPAFLSGWLMNTITDTKQIRET